MNRKIDLSNEDHWGPCGEYMLEKTQSTNNKIKNKMNNKSYKYLQMVVYKTMEKKMLNLHMVYILLIVNMTINMV